MSGRIRSGSPYSRGVEFRRSALIAPCSDTVPTGWTMSGTHAIDLRAEDAGRILALKTAVSGDLHQYRATRHHPRTPSGGL